MATQNMGWDNTACQLDPKNRDVEYMKRGYTHDYSKTRLQP